MANHDVDAALAAALSAISGGKGRDLTTGKSAVSSGNVTRLASMSKDAGNIVVGIDSIEEQAKAILAQRVNKLDL